MTAPTITAQTAPVQEQLEVPCGMDWTVAVEFIDADSGAPINVSTPKMQVRSGPYETAPLILAPTLSVNANAVTVLFPGSVTAAVGVPRGFYDLTVTRTDTGAPVRLLYGPVLFLQNVTNLS